MLITNFKKDLFHNNFKGFRTLATQIYKINSHQLYGLKLQ